MALGHAGRLSLRDYRKRRRFNVINAQDIQSIQGSGEHGANVKDGSVCRMLCEVAGTRYHGCFDLGADEYVF